MTYFKRLQAPARPVRLRRGLLGMGDFTDTDQCSTIPLGDPYRKPGNYCATPDGGTTTFNADGTTYRAPGYAVDPDPAHPAGTGAGGSASSTGSGGGFLDSLTRALTGAIAPPPTVIVPGASSGMSTGTMLALAGGAVLVAVLLARR